MKRNQKGFTHIVVLLTLLIAVVVGGVGYYVWHRDHNKTVASSTSGNSATTAISIKETPAQASSADSYADWKTYCDTVYRYCFKYPSSWQFHSSQPSGVGDVASTYLLNSKSTIQVNYINSFNKDITQTSFNITSVDKPSSSTVQNLSVVGGYYDFGTGDNGLSGRYEAIYGVLPGAWSVGMSNSFPTNTYFDDKATTGTYIGNFECMDAVTMNDLQSAKDWFKLADAKTCLLIIKSFYQK